MVKNTRAVANADRKAVGGIWKRRAICREFQNFIMDIENIYHRSLQRKKNIAVSGRGSQGVNEITRFDLIHKIGIIDFVPFTF